jgi:peroxiredoxin
MRRWGITSSLLGIVLASGSATALEVGEKAPAFTLPATTVDKLSLADYLGKKNVVLFGFIGAFTPT